MVKIKTPKGFIKLRTGAKVQRYDRIWNDKWEVLQLKSDLCPVDPAEYIIRKKKESK